jgi:hypothetical protein
MLIDILVYRYVTVPTQNSYFNETVVPWFNTMQYTYFWNLLFAILRPRWPRPFILSTDLLFRKYSHFIESDFILRCVAFIIRAYRRICHMKFVDHIQIYIYKYYFCQMSSIFKKLETWWSLFRSSCTINIINDQYTPKPITTDRPTDKISLLVVHFMHLVQRSHKYSRPSVESLNIG